MNESNSPKKVVTTLNSGIASPIPVDTNDAMNIARAQSIIGKKEETEEEITNIEELKEEVNTEAINKVNDLVKVVEVKNDKKVVLILGILLAIILIIFIIFELPMLLEL